MEPLEKRRRTEEPQPTPSSGSPDVAEPQPGPAGGPPDVAEPQPGPSSDPPALPLSAPGAIVETCRWGLAYPDFIRTRRQLRKRRRFVVQQALYHGWMRMTIPAYNPPVHSTRYFYRVSAESESDLESGPASVASDSSSSSESDAIIVVSDSSSSSVQIIE